MRAKVVAEDGNEIETMFVDRRGSAIHGQGDQLVSARHGGIEVSRDGSVGPLTRYSEHFTEIP